MTVLLENYLQNFIHPFRTQEAHRLARRIRESIDGQGQLQLADDSHQKNLELKASLTGIGVNLYEAMGISWLFIIVKIIQILKNGGMYYGY